MICEIINENKSHQ